MIRLSRICLVLCLFAATAGTGQMFAQGVACQDPWINSAFNQIYHRAPQGSGRAGECNINLYGGGRWSSYQDLYNKVLGSKYCQDPWIGEAWVVAFRQRPTAAQCSPANYGGGRWSGFDDLVAKVQQYQRQASYRPAPPPPAPYNPAAASPRVAIVSKMGAKCLDAENGRIARGTRLIGYPCNGNSNEQFQFNANGTITMGNLCVDASSGLGRDGDQIQLWDCNGGANQRWRLMNFQLVGINNKCVDLQNGRAWWTGNQPAILYSCNGQENQYWIKGVVVPGSRVRGFAPVQPGTLTTLLPTNTTAAVIAAGAGNVIAAGAGNVIAAGAGNVIAAGAGNVIAAGAGNVIVTVRQ